MNLGQEATILLIFKFYDESFTIFRYYKKDKK